MFFVLRLTPVQNILLDRERGTPDHFEDQVVFSSEKEKTELTWRVSKELVEYTGSLRMLDHPEIKAFFSIILAGDQNWRVHWKDFSFRQLNDDDLVMSSGLPLFPLQTEANFMAVKAYAPVLSLWLRKSTPKDREFFDYQKAAKRLNLWELVGHIGESEKSPEQAQVLNRKISAGWTEDEIKLARLIYKTMTSDKMIPVNKVPTAS